MKSSLRLHHQAVVILLIVLIHGGMLMTFVMVQFQSQPHEAVVMIEQEQAQPSDRDWIAMNNSLPQTQLVAQNPSHTPQTTPDNQPKVFEDAKDEELIEAQALNEPEQEPQEIAAEEIDTAIALASQLLKKTKQKEDEPLHEEEKEATRPKTQLASQSNPMQPTPTLAQLAQGFVEHLQQAEMAVRSNRNGTASIDQIKHISYCKKILGCVVNSYKINTRGVSRKLLDNRARIQLALNRNGSIAHLALEASSGDPSVDQFLIDMFRDASSSFPPVPVALQDDPYRLPTFSIDSLESFRTSEGWYIDN